MRELSAAIRRAPGWLSLLALGLVLGLGLAQSQALAQECPADVAPANAALAVKCSGACASDAWIELGALGESQRPRSGHAWLSPSDPSQKQCGPQSGYVELPVTDSAGTGHPGFNLAALAEAWLKAPETRRRLVENLTARQDFVVALEGPEAGKLQFLRLQLDLGALWKDRRLVPQVTAAHCGTSATVCHFNDELTISVSGLAPWQNHAGGDPQKLDLVLAGVRLRGVRATPIADQFQFLLAPPPADSRDAHEDWSDFLARVRTHPAQAFSITLAGDAGAFTPAPQPLRLDYRISPLGLTAGTLLALLIAFMALGRRTRWRMLRDSMPPGLPTWCVIDPATLPFSLGRCQAVFWTLCLTVSGFAVWAQTSQFFPFDTNTVLLLGISGATAGVSMAADPDPKLAELIRAASAPAVPPLRSPQETLASALRSKNLVADILADYGADDSGLHRVQVVLFSLLFGLRELWCATWLGQLPPLEGPQLLLLGISGGTYVGWKIFMRS